ncbi:158_t:CDS:2 [Paraglomus brasilianum]|uniref:158_t:CDS:1 n=1 Tax=Paraglomus brasilianum TaxID=144538 RepID=A0A9N9GNE7_9GLOM|nr:158_t:CDS:2 [Paraglomus brasilianum]
MSASGPQQKQYLQVRRLSLHRLSGHKHNNMSKCSMQKWGGISLKGHLKCETYHVYRKQRMPQAWGRLSEDEKLIYYLAANVVEKKFYEDNPGYVYRPK